MLSHGPAAPVLPTEEPGADSKRCFKKSRAEFMDSDGDLIIFRRFGELGIRSLLHMQASLAQLECELRVAQPPGSRTQANDDPEANPPPGHGDDDKDALMRRLQGLLKDYNAALLAHAAVQKIPSPRKVGIKDFCFAITNTRAHGPADLTNDALENMLAHRRDLVSLVPRQPKGLCKVLERIELLQHAFGDEERNDPRFPKFFYYHERHVERLERFIICTGFCVMLLLPTFLLAFVTSRVWQLVITGLFTLAGCLGSAALTRANTWEVFSITAGYCAILVVFLGNLH